MTWTSRTLKASWRGRYSHTSVIDAAGAIYILGGVCVGGEISKDVWMSTNGGADPTRAGDSGVLKGTLAVLGVLRGYW